MLPLLCALVALPLHIHEGAVQAFTSLTDAQGHIIADGKFLQRIEGERLFIEARYDFPDGRVVEERARLRLAPELLQEEWDWTEKKGDVVLRRYEVDFLTHTAVGHKGNDSWREDVEVEPGKTFAGIGFVEAVKTLRSELKHGEEFKLRAIAMTPKPRSVGLIVTRNESEKISMAGRHVPAERWTLHPDVPAIAKLFVKAPDQHVWLFADQPASFLRFEGPLCEPEDPIIHVDLIPGPPAH